MNVNRDADEEKTPFLDDASSSVVSLSVHEASRPRCSRRPSRSWIVVILAVVTITSLASNICLVLRTKDFTNSRPLPCIDIGLKTPFSPADPFVSYKLEAIDLHDEKDPFVGPPGPTFDQAWSDLLSATSISVSAEELRRAGKQSLRLRDADDESYLAYLETYHQLHCVKRMVQSRWPDRYPDLIASNALSDEHFNHCIQVLRKGVMCSGDTTLNTFTRDATNLTHIVGVTDAPRKCIDWRRLDDWARGRAVKAHPKFYTAGEEGWIGPN